MRTLRRQIYMLLTAMTISAVIILVSAGKSVERQKAAAAARQADMAQHDPVGFVLGEYNGKLALFRENSVRPYKLLDMEVYLLSEEDRAALEKGIVFETEEELLRVLEDWNS